MAPASPEPPSSPFFAKSALHGGAFWDHLALHSFVVIDDFLTAAPLSNLIKTARKLVPTMRPANIGFGQTKRQDFATRGDHIRWIEAEDLPNAPALSAVVEELRELRHLSNQNLHCGLRGFETHIASYPPGTGYLRHIDKLKDAPDERFLSFVLYLNQNWRPEHGGALRLYTEGLSPETQNELGPHCDIDPIAGRLVLFRSDLVWHEVRATTADRLSLTGWFVRGVDHLRMLLS